MKNLAKLAAAGLILSAAPALAQQAPGPETPPEANNPLTDDQVAAAASDFTDNQIDSFAEAAIGINQVAQDPQLDDAAKQSAMVAIVQEVGIDPATFNAIGAAIQTDPAVQQRVQMAINELQAPSQNQ